MPACSAPRVLQEYVPYCSAVEAVREAWKKEVEDVKHSCAFRSKIGGGVAYDFVAFYEIVMH